MKKVVFIAKTNLNNDGRILNQIRILQNHYNNKLRIDFILFADKPLTIDLGENVIVHQILTTFRNSSFLRLFTVMEFSLKVLMKLFKLKPTLIHAQDLAIAFPVYMYKKLSRHSFKLIYDDHEMPNENESFQYRVFQYFEVKLLKCSDYVLFANKERLDILKVQHNLTTKLAYFLNLPYFDDKSLASRNDIHAEKINDLRVEVEGGKRFIMHQGILEVERGREKLAYFSKLLPEQTYLMMVGISKEDFLTFVEEYNLDVKHFHWIGSVPYEVLNQYWNLVEAAVVMYLPTFINNRLCAPNRLYIAVDHQIPVLVNRDNPVLSNFVEDYKIGRYIEDINGAADVENLLSYTYTIDIMRDLKKRESDKIVEIYEHL